MKSLLAVTSLLLAATSATSSDAGRFPVRDQLNDADRGAWADDTADVLKPRQLLYETRDDGRYRVGYNLIRERDGDAKGYFVRLTIENLSSNPITASAEVALIDAEGAVIPATDRDTFRSFATTLAGAKVPAAALKAVARPASGETAFQAYLRGQAEGAVLKAANDAATGRGMTIWADGFWLKPTLDLPPRLRISGVRAFLAEPYHPLPLTLRVKIGESEFDFTTRAK
jgi:hypothetical protein